MAKDLAIILNNGSVNSAVATALAAQKFRTIMLYAEEGEEPSTRSRAAFDLQVAHFKPYREHTLPMPFLSLIQPARDVPPVASDPRHPAPIAPLMVDLLPLISAALRFAVHYQAAAVYLGLRVGPSADELAQATEYMQIWNELIQLPCNQPEINLEMPLLELEPWQVVDVGVQASVPFDRTWSCEDGGGEPCWACKSCRTREAAFQQAGKADPLRVVRKV
jgi:7-cyano-7-deazaguanine synthase in queuosine biosynthesis